MRIELKTVFVAILFSVFFGLMYEITAKRAYVLYACFILLAIAMALPFIHKFEHSEQVILWSRIAVFTLVQAIIQNPLLLDYVKKRNRG